jgi:hypothetical protein
MSLSERTWRPQGLMFDTNLLSAVASGYKVRLAVKLGLKTSRVLTPPTSVFWCKVAWGGC